MTTGHINPGYGNMVSALQRCNRNRSNNIASLPGSNLLQTMGRSNVDDMTLYEIRRKAREAWSRPPSHHTSYSNHYGEKLTEMDTPTHSRPTSSDRRNKPHPSMVFLSNHLHSVPGYHNPDATLGKEVYKVDDSVSKPEQMARKQIKEKFSNRPNTAAVMQFRDNPELEYMQKLRRSLLMPNSGHPADNIHTEQDYSDEEAQFKQDFSNDMRSQAIPSIHRYLKPAGMQELDNIVKSNVGRRSYSAGSSIHQRGPTLGEQRRFDRQRMTNIKYPTSGSTRGDFLMHPEWKPHIYHHRLNGLSSVDLPYSKTQR